MQKCTFKMDFSDVERKFSEFDNMVKSRVEAVGKEAVEYAVENGTYRDVTGHLRRSNRYSVDAKNNLNLRNETDYAEDVEARGEDVLSNAALFAEKRLREEFGK